MRKVFLLFLVFSFLIITRSHAVADHVVIVNPGNAVASISKKDLKYIYKMKKTTWDGGGAIQPVNLEQDSDVRSAFSEKNLGKNTKSMEKYYMKRALSGKGQPPKVFSTDAEVIKFVSSNKGAIGYVSNADSSVKVISVK